MPEETTTTTEETTTPAEEPAATPTLEELAAQVETLSQNLTAMQELLLEVIGEVEYELRYSGEDIDTLLDKGNTTYGRYAVDSLLASGNTVFNNKSAALINYLVNRLYPLVMKWGSFTLEMKVNADNGSQWSWGTRTGLIPSGISSPAVFMVCDWNKLHFKAQSFSYKISSNGTDVEWEAYLEHTSDQGGTYSFKVYYLVLGKNTNGGSIIG